MCTWTEPGGFARPRAGGAKAATQNNLLVFFLPKTIVSKWFFVLIYLALVSKADQQASTSAQVAGDVIVRSGIASHRSLITKLLKAFVFKLFGVLQLCRDSPEKVFFNLVRKGGCDNNVEEPWRDGPSRVGPPHKKGKIGDLIQNPSKHINLHIYIYIYIY